MANDFLDTLPDVLGNDDFLSSIPDAAPRDIGLKSSHEIIPFLPSHVTGPDQAKAIAILTNTAYLRHVKGVPVEADTVAQFPMDGTHPQAKELQSFSGMVVNHWDSTQRAIERADLFSQRNTRMMLGQGTADLDEQIGALGKIEKFRKPANPFEKAVAFTAEQIPYFVDTIKEGSTMGMATAIVGTSAYLLGTYGVGAPAAPAVFASLYAAGTMVGSSKRLWEVAEGMSYEEMTERGVNEQDAMLTSRFVVGPLSAALNTIGLRQVSKVIPGMDKILGVATRKTAEKMARTVPQILGRNLANVGKAVGVETFTENLDELAQVAGTQIGIEVTNAFDNKGLSDVTVAEIKKRMLAVTEATIYATAVMGGAGGTAGTVLDVGSIKSEAKRREKIVDVIETAMDKTNPIVREKARSTGAVIVGVSEDDEGNVTGLLMADRKTGNFFETGPNPTQTEIAEFTGGEVGIDETVDRIILADDLDAEVEKLFDKTEAIGSVAERTPESRPIVEILKDINAAIGEVGAIGKGFNPESVSALVGELGQSAWNSGARTFEQFATTVKEQAGDAWEAIKEIAAKAWETIKEFNESLGEVGAVGADLGIFNESDIMAHEDIDPASMAEYANLANEIDAKTEDQLAANYTQREKAAFKEILKQAKALVEANSIYASMREAVTRGGLNLANLQVDYSKEDIKALVRRAPGIVSKEGTLSLDELANEQGFDSADSLMESWLGVTPKAEEIAKQAQDIFNNEYSQYEGNARAATYFEDLLAAEQEIIAGMKQDPRSVPKSAKGIKNVVRRKTGQTDTSGMVTERTALKAAFTKAAQAARAAKREGKKEALAAARVDLAGVVAKMKVRQAEAVGKIMTEKEKVQHRRESIRNIRDYFGLSDADLKRISKKDPRLMSDYEFKKFKDGMQLKAVELAETRQAKLELLSTIDALRLEKVDNYRKALALPPISEMTTEELRKFDQLLSQQQEGDSFLNRRQLETVDRTFLAGIKTWREAREKLATEAGVSVTALEKIKVTGWDNFRWDTLLYEANPFYRVLVTRVNSALLDGQLKAHEIESKIYDLAKKAQASVSRGIVERALPSDEIIFNYLESDSAGKKTTAEHMTPEQIDLAHYMQEYFSQALVYLMETKSLEKGRENYFVHLRRSFLETIKDDGLTSAVKQMFQNYEQDEMAFGILNEATGQILPLEKFFQFSLRRTGKLVPSKNIVKAFLTYVNTFEKKVVLDGIMPAMDIYAQSLTPTKYTPRGLEIDRSIKEFVYKYINNKKGRRISFDSVLKQGGRLDLGINALRTLTTTLDLGFNVIAQLASPIGEQAANMLGMGITNQAKGTARYHTAQGKRIVKKYEAFVGRTFWENFTAPGEEVTGRMSSALFAGFHVGTRIANGQFLLGMMTDQEFKAGEISAPRLAELKIDMGRFRVVAGSKSLVGSTSAGKAGIQYKSWAIPVLHRTLKDTAVFLKDLKGKPLGEALTTRESVELARIVGLTATIIAVNAAFAADDEDDSFIGKLLARAYQEANIIYSTFNKKKMVSVPRVFTYLQQLVINITSIEKLWKQHNPRFIKQFEPEKKKF